MPSSACAHTGGPFPEAGAVSRPSEKRPSRDAQPAAAEKSRPVRLVIAGGGTGGHLFPGIAVAEEVLARNTDSSVLFIGTGKPFETAILGEKGFCHAAISVQGIKNLGLLKQARAFTLLPMSLYASAKILKSFRPDLVLGVGGYSAGPVVAAAWMMGVKTALQEQNVLPGITNRWLSHIADRLYLSFPETKGIRTGKKALVTGNPVRREFFAATPPLEQAGETGANAAKALTVLVVGGSQGAHGINLAMRSALTFMEGRHRLHVIHQTGSDDVETMQKAYAESGVSSTVKAFFTDMAQQYRRADLIICRAGATTVAEVTVLGKAVIFIPYPHAADDHQRLNAESMVAAGAAELILEKNLTGERLAGRIQHYAGSPDLLARMGHRASMLGRPNAARVIVDDMYELVHSG
ncbi:MAG: undecaprenyldiphospho-muramoylpentapeptide beta-N-acetylglucosaminyltransferase [Deltaproteobacteria bacterium]|nr:undecaprenyldiphospho-muramoylpentapeptide beta-N-acetylglucosaminyltransferase [Deltaproteobacteria bacterium]